MRFSTFTVKELRSEVVDELIYIHDENRFLIMMSQRLHVTGRSGTADGQ